MAPSDLGADPGANPARDEPAAIAASGLVRLGPALAVIGLTALAYANSFRGVFLFDDLEHLRPGAFDRFWPPAVLWSRPLIYLSCYLNFRLGGWDPWGYHALNLTVHAATALLLLGIWNRTLALPRYRDRLTPATRRNLALGATLLWAVHPLNTQAVTYVIQRCESIAACFCVAALYALVRGATSARPRPWYAGAAASYWAACSAKEWAAVLPLVLAAYDVTFLSGSWREAWRRRGRWYALVCAPAIALLPYLVWLLRTNETVGYSMKSVGTLDYAQTQPEVIWHYLRLLVVPDPLCLDYRWMIERSWPWIVGPTAALTALGFWGLRQFRRRSAGGFLVLSFFVLLAPTSSFAPIADLAFEHRMYLPSACVLGAALLALWCGLRRLAAAAHRPQSRADALTTGLVVGAIGVFALLTARRNLDYHDDVRMWTTVVRTRPLNYRAWGNLGAANFRKGRHEPAVAALERALAIHADYYPSYYALGECYDVLGRTADALRMYELALKHDPEHAAVHNNLGRLAEREQRFDEAERRYRRAMTSAPQWALPRYNLGRLLVERGRTDEARRLFDEALRREPTFGPALRARQRLSPAGDAGTTAPAARL